MTPVSDPAARASPAGGLLRRSRSPFGSVSAPCDGNVSTLALTAQPTSPRKHAYRRRWPLLTCWKWPQSVGSPSSPNPKPLGLGQVSYAVVVPRHLLARTSASRREGSGMPLVRPAPLTCRCLPSGGGYGAGLSMLSGHPGSRTRPRSSSSQRPSSAPAYVSTRPLRRSTGDGSGWGGAEAFRASSPPRQDRSHAALGKGHHFLLAEKGNRDYYHCYPR